MALLLPGNAVRLMSGVLRGFVPAAYEESACGVPLVRLDENSCAALLIKKTSPLWMETDVGVAS